MLANSGQLIANLSAGRGAHLLNSPLRSSLQPLWVQIVRLRQRIAVKAVITSADLPVRKTARHVTPRLRRRGRSPLLREIKTRRPDLPVMVVTVYGDDERRRYPSASRRVSR